MKSFEEELVDKIGYLLAFEQDKKEAKERYGVDW